MIQKLTTGRLIWMHDSAYLIYQITILIFHPSPNPFYFLFIKICSPLEESELKFLSGLRGGSFLSLTEIRWEQKKKGTVLLLLALDSSNVAEVIHYPFNT